MTRFGLWIFMSKITHDFWLCVFDLRATSGAEAAYPSGAPEFNPVFSGVRVTRFLVSCVCFIDRCLSFCPFSFCVVCPSSIYEFWLPPFGIFNLFLTTCACSLTLLDIWKKNCYYIDGICGESREYKILTILSVTFQYYLSLFNNICHFSILSVTFLITVFDWIQSKLQPY